MHREVEAHAHLMLSRMDPKRYVESKQARLTRRRLNAFRISFRDMMTEAIELPTMPNTARVVCKNRNGCMTNARVNSGYIYLFLIFMPMLLPDLIPLFGNYIKC